MASEADALIEQASGLADQLDATPHAQLAASARRLAMALEEYFICFGKPDAPKPQGTLFGRKP